MIPRSSSSGEGFHPFMDDADIVEQGLSKDLITEELYLPSHELANWIRCFVVEDGGVFKMYLEDTKRFVLSAKKYSSDVLLISAHEESIHNWPNNFLPRRGYLAKLVRQKNSSTFILSLNTCRLCDSKLGYFSCGRGPGQREVLAKVVHSIKRFVGSDVDVKCISASIPTVTAAGRRPIWCPRYFKIKHSNISVSSDVSEALGMYPDLIAKFTSKLPEWNENHNRLTLKFEGNRILCPSSKNFLLVESYDQKSSESGGDIGAVSAVLQFGRRGTREYALDFRHPVSPIQAFSVALSTFAFDSADLFPKKDIMAGASPLPSPLSSAKHHSEDDAVSLVSMSKFSSQIKSFFFSDDNALIVRGDDTDNKSGGVRCANNKKDDRMSLKIPDDTIPSPLLFHHTSYDADQSSSTENYLYADWKE